MLLIEVCNVCSSTVEVLIGRLWSHSIFVYAIVFPAGEDMISGEVLQAAVGHWVYV